VQQNKQTTKKAFEANSLWIAMLLGGPLAAGYIISSNELLFGRKTRAIITWIVVITFLVSYGLLYEFFPSWLQKNSASYAVCYLLAIPGYWYVYHAQGPAIEKHLAEGGKMQPRYRAFAVGLSCLAIVAVITFAPQIIERLTPAGTTEVRIYGTENDRIVFDKTNISVYDVNTLAEAFTATGFFNQKEQAKEVFVERNESKLEVQVPANASGAKDTSFTNAVKEWRNQLQSFYDKQHITVIVVNAENKEDTLFKAE
jgi:hypothetical protein